MISRSLSHQLRSKAYVVDMYPILSNFKEEFDRLGYDSNLTYIAENFIFSWISVNEGSYKDYRSLIDMVVRGYCLDEDVAIRLIGESVDHLNKLLSNLVNILSEYKNLYLKYEEVEEMVYLLGLCEIIISGEKNEKDCLGTI